MSHRVDEEDLSWCDITTAISAEPVPVTASSRDKACLIVIAGGQLGEMVRVGDQVTVGRSVEADLCIPDDGVSRIHMRVERRQNGSIWVVDESSRNGTYVDGQRVQEVELHDGNKIYIGTRAILRFSYTDHLEENFQQQMYDAALRDSLTGLFNRRHLLAQLQIEFNYVQRHSSALTLVMIDLDHFKQINDVHGHLVGDAVLRAFGGCLRQGIRGADFAARYGGEEFVLVCRGAGPEEGLQVAQRFQQQTRGVSLVTEVPDLRLTFSAGVVSIPDARFDSVAALLRAADKALYAAKDGGRDRIEVYR